MGKIVKYCAACDESFAEKFGYCPNCGQAMTAFEMNPLAKDTPISEEVKTDAVVNEPTIQTVSQPTAIKTAPVVEASPVVETATVSAGQTRGFSEEVKASIIEDKEAAPEVVPTATKTFAAAASANGNGNNQTANYNFQDAAEVKPYKADDGYRITVIEEKNVKQRNLLLLGSMALMLTLALGGTVYSLFNKDLLVGAINEESGIFVPIVDEEPVEVEEQPKPKNDKDAGGGGGGGREEQEEASKGRLVSQSENPITPPNAKSVQLTNPDIKLVYETKGNITRPVTEERPGLPGSDNLNPSNGTGRGGGIGSGTGTGIGSGNGEGEGSGNGSGSGSGNGNGNGGGNGSGTAGSGSIPKPPPPRPAGVTTGVKIISKPQPKYTDAARQNNFSGTVRLKVTFLSSGQIGSVSPVGSLPYGLTEQAIAAAKSIRFEPAKKDGVPIPKVMNVEYSFTLY